MNLLNLSLPTPAENLALDEALLETAEAAGRPTEALRLWESPTPIVVVGRASRVDEEVNVAACQESGIPIFRRHSGGAAIVAGQGCLMYAVVLSYDRRPHLRMIDEAHRFALETMAAGLQIIDQRVQRSGISDLTIAGGMKFSGNSLRCCRTHLLYHGTLLYDFPLELIAQCLKQPHRQPDYREQRSHETFVANLPASREALRAAVIAAWQGRTDCQVRPTGDPAAADSEVRPTATRQDWPMERTARLAAEKYSSDEWNLRR